MWRGFSSLLKKDFKLMLSSKFFLLALGSLVLYSCYINFVYVNIDQQIYPVYLYDPQEKQTAVSEYVTKTESRESLEEACTDQYSIGIDLSKDEPEWYMLSAGVETVDHYRMIWAEAVLAGKPAGQAEVIGTNSKEMKSRREITAEFLFFELAAVGFLGLASMLFKEKQMGVIRVHGIMPVSKSAFILSKLLMILLSDLVFAALLTVFNLGVPEGFRVLPAVFIQTGILSLVMAFVGFLCAVRLPDFKQFSLLYLVIAVFVTTPVFLAGQTGASWNWIVCHPMYHMFMAMKSAYFEMPIVALTVAKMLYYFISASVIGLLFWLAYRALTREMAKEG